MAAVHLAEIIALDVYSTTITTTKIPINILMPVPLTDVWDPGETLRTSTLVALNMINQQQQLLPGYEVKVEFMDSQRGKASFPCKTG